MRIVFSVALCCVSFLCLFFLFVRCFCVARCVVAFVVCCVSFGVSFILSNDNDNDDEDDDVDGDDDTDDDRHILIIIKSIIIIIGLTDIIRIAGTIGIL